MISWGGSLFQPGGTAVSRTTPNEFILKTRYFMEV